MRQRGCLFLLLPFLGFVPGTGITRAWPADLEMVLPVRRPLGPGQEPGGVPAQPAPPETEQAPDLELLATGAEAGKADLDRVLLDRLRTIVFKPFDPPPPGTACRVSMPCARAAAVISGGRPGQAARVVASEGVQSTVEALGPALADPGSPLSLAIQAAREGPFTLRRLQGLVQETTKAAREGGGGSLARASAPGQELSGGELLIVVAPIWLEEIKVTGAGRTDPALLRWPYAGLVGSTIFTPELDRAFRRVPEHPYRSVHSALVPGKAPGSTAVELRLNEAKPWTVFAGYETTHSRDGGPGRQNVGFTAAAPWRPEDLWTVQYTVDSRLGPAGSVALVYDAYMFRGHVLTATGLWTRSISGGVFSSDSTDWMLRLFWEAPLPEARGWRHSARAGAEWRRTGKTSRFAGMTIGEYAVTALPVTLGWQGRRPDKAGAWALSAEAQMGVDWGLSHMNRREYALSRESAGPGWLALRGSATRDQALPGGWGLQSRVWGQWSPDRLAEVGKFSVGGARSVRGYREGEVSGDTGLGATLEIISPTLVRLPPPPSAETAPNQDSAEQAPKTPAGRRAVAACDFYRSWRPLDVRLAAFFDAAWAFQSAPRPAYERRMTGLAGAGLGFRLKYGSHVSFKADYAWRLRGTGAAEDDRCRGFGYLTLNVSW